MSLSFTKLKQLTRESTGKRLCDMQLQQDAGLNRSLSLSLCRLLVPARAYNTAVRSVVLQPSPLHLSDLARTC